MPSEIGLTILIVEDEKSIRKLIGMALAEAGYTVLEAGNSAEAVRAFQTSPNGVDLVIMDLVMPGGGGLDAANELRAIRADLKILYITGYRDTTLSRCIAEGAPSAMLFKPFSASELLARVASFLENGSALPD